MACVIRRLFVLVATTLALSACQVDVSVDVAVEPDGTGLITVIATADAELVAQVPSLANDLALDDVIAAGWSIDGPNPTADGGLTMHMSHPFASATEATNLLQSLGPPFAQMDFSRSTTGDVTTTSLSGRMVLTSFDAFADSDLVEAVGSEPFAEQIAENGATPGESFTATLRVALPGELETDLTNVAPNDAGVLVWELPNDGTPTLIQAETRQAPGEGGRWARPLSIAVLVLLIAWVALMTVFIGYVAIARFRRARAYKHRHLGSE